MGKREKANNFWKRMQEHAYEKICGIKCRGEEPSHISPYDIFFSDEVLVMKPEDFAEGSDLEGLRQFLKEKRNCQARLFKDELLPFEDELPMSCCNGISFCVREDLSVVARDVSRAWALFYNGKNVPRVRVVFRNDCARVVFDDREILRRSCQTPISIDEDAANFLRVLYLGKLRSRDHGILREEPVSAEELFVPEGSLDISYGFSGTGYSYVSCARLTDAAVRKYRDVRERTFLDKFCYKSPAGPHMIHLIMPLDGKGNFCVHPDITPEEQAVLLKGLSGPDEAALREAFLDAKRPEQELAKACEKVSEMTGSLSELVLEKQEDILDAVLLRWGCDRSVLEGLKMYQKKSLLEIVRDYDRPHRLYFSPGDDAFARMLDRAKALGLIKRKLSSFRIGLPCENMDKKTMTFEAEAIMELAEKKGLDLSYTVL